MDGTFLDHIRVLVVDDEPDFLTLTADLLVAHHADVAVARSAEEALGIVVTFRPHVVLSDIEMPGHDGYQLMRMLRSRAAAAPEGPPAAIALTGHAGVLDQTRALLAGFTMHVAKPYAPEELCAAIKRVYGRRQLALDAKP